jgi:hypothetical protein
MTEYCCESFREDQARTCDVHQHRHDCPDALIGRAGDGYGIYVHDGGSSVITIQFCPWCGSKLPGANTDDSLPDDEKIHLSS